MKVNFRDLKIYKMAKSLSVETYILAKDFPKYEEYGLSSQLRRASSSIGANLAEGYAMTSRNQLRFYRIAKGSLRETIFLIELAFDLGYLRSEQKVQLISKLTDLDVKIFNYMTYIKSKKPY